MNQVCKICGNQEGNEYYTVKERIINNGEEFTYLLCKKCNTLQLNEDVSDIAKYYKGDYYSYNVTSHRLLIPCCIVKPFLWKMIKNDHMSYRVDRFLSKKIFPIISSIKGTKVDFSSSLLDVGAGNGFFGEFLAKNGFKDVTCIDKYCKKSPFSHITFKQCDVLDLDDDKKYDLITLFSSFEHMDNPKEILKKISKIMSNNGKCLMTIPLFGSTAWDLYKTNWFQIDAPRHFFLYSIKSFEYLCKQCNLLIDKVEFKSSKFQFLVSKYYSETDLSLGDIYKLINKLSKRELYYYERKAIEADINGKGDYARIILKKKE